MQEISLKKVLLLIPLQHLILEKKTTSWQQHVEVMKKHMKEPNIAFLLPLS